MTLCNEKVILQLADAYLSCLLQSLLNCFWGIRWGRLTVLDTLFSPSLGRARARFHRQAVLSGSINFAVGLDSVCPLSSLAILGFQEAYCFAGSTCMSQWSSFHVT